MGKTLSEKEWQAKNADLLVRGLDNTLNYLVLSRGETLHLAIRPLVARAGHSLFVGGKVKVAYNDGSAGSIDELMAFTGLKPDFWAKVTDRRVSRMLGVAFVAPKHQWESFFNSFNPKDFAKAMIHKIQEVTGLQVAEKLRLYNALDAYYKRALKEEFYSNPVEVAPAPTGKSFPSVADVTDLNDYKASKEEQEAMAGVEEEGEPA